MTPPDLSAIAERAEKRYHEDAEFHAVATLLAQILPYGVTNVVRTLELYEAFEANGLAIRSAAEVGRLQEENTRLEKEVDEAQLRSIEARNPGINMDEVRRAREALR